MSIKNKSTPNTTAKGHTYFLKMDELIQLQMQINGSFDDLDSRQIESIFDSIKKGQILNHAQGIDTVAVSNGHKQESIENVTDIQFRCIKKLKTDFWSPFVTRSEDKANVDMKVHQFDIDRSANLCRDWIKSTPTKENLIDISQDKPLNHAIDDFIENNVEHETSIMLVNR